jgi:hypothetical protein
VLACQVVYKSYDKQDPLEGQTAAVAVELQYANKARPIYDMEWVMVANECNLTSNSP